MSYECEFLGSFQSSENPKIEIKTTTKKKHSLSLLIAIAFRYYNYECFCSQIDLTELTIDKGEPGKSLNKRNVCLLDVTHLSPCEPH